MGRRFKCPGCGTAMGSGPSTTQLGSGPRPGPSEAPQQVARFAIRKRLGAGAFGTVYRAFDPQLEREVALKVPNAGVLGTPDRVERFLREARAAANLRHPNIVPVYDAGQDGERYFIASAFIDGRPLSAAVEEGGPLDFRRAARLAAELAGALAYAHGEGVIHRDVKPDNCMLDTQDRLHLMDFGLAARGVDGVAGLSGTIAEGGPENSKNNRLTTAGSIMGTPSYMAPEQAEGKTEEIGPAADQYACGIVLYELITGRTPFDGPSFLVMHHQIHTPPDPPSTYRLDVPRDLEAISLRAMSKHPSDRYLNCQELADDLNRWLDGEVIRARPIGALPRLWRRCRKYPVVAGLVALVAVLLVVGAVGSGVAAIRMRNLADKERAASDQTRDALRREQEASKLARKQSEALEQQLYVSRVAQAMTLWNDGNIADGVRQLDACPERLRGWEWHHVRGFYGLERWKKTGLTDTVWGVAYSPDGRRVVIGTSPGGIWNTTQGQGVVLLCDAETGREIRRFSGLGGGVLAVAFSPDGSRVAAATGLRSPSTYGELFVWESESGQPVFRRQVDSTNLLSVAFSPDGSRIATGRGIYNDSTSGLGRACQIWDAQTGDELLTIPGGDGGVFSVAYHPDGKRIAVASAYTVALHDAETGRLIRKFEGHQSFVYAVAFARDGASLATAGGPIRIWDVESGHLLQTLPSSSLALAFDSTGTKIAGGLGNVVRVWDVKKGDEIASYRGHRSTFRCVAFNPRGEGLLTGGTDGTAILWAAQQSRNIGLQKVARKAPYSWAMGGAVTNDGKKAVTASRDGVVQVWDLDTGATVHVWDQPMPSPDQTGELWSGQISPDGRQFAAASEWRIYRFDTASWAELPALEGPKGPVLGLTYSPDSQYLAATGYDRKVSIWNAQSGRVERSWPLPPGAPPGASIAFSPDGKLIATGLGGFSWDRGAGVLVVWDARSGARLFTVATPEGYVRTVAFSPDGTELYAGLGDGHLDIYRVADWTRARRLKPHGRMMYAIAFTPDGSRYATSGDGGIRLFETRSDRELMLLMKYGTNMLAFSKDGHKLIADFGVFDATPIEDRPPDPPPAKSADEELIRSGSRPQRADSR